MLENVQAVEAFLESHFAERGPRIGEFSPLLLDSIRYSLNNGGKRFRPSLCLATAQALMGDVEKSVAFAGAIEMIHTYSLIHDDLPCMDNDDMRRGQPTNHKKFGEPLALLAGDALLTESFYVIASNYNGDEAGELVALLADAAGPAGMVGGQAMDMGFGAPINSRANLERVQRGKTAALIAVAVEGAGVIAGVDASVQKNLRELGFLIGACFQIKDDLLDGEQDKSEKNYIFHLGVEGTQKLLEQTTQRAHETIRQLPPSCRKLGQFLEFNSTRDK